MPGKIIYFFTGAICLCFPLAAKSLQQEAIVPKESQISDYEARLTLAQVLFYDKKFKRSIAQYLILLQQKPNDPDLEYEIGKVYIADQQWHHGLRRLAQALHQKPDSIPILLAASQAETALGHFVIADNYLQKILQIGGGALSKDTLLSYADQLIARGDYYQAETLYEKMLVKTPHDKDLMQRMADLYIYSQRYEEAEKALAKLRYFYPSHKPLLLSYVNLRLQQKDFVEALRHTEELLALEPRNSEFLLLKGDVLFAGRCFEEAIAAYLQVSLNSGQYVKAQLGLGKAYRQLFDFENANAALEKAASVEPENIDSRYHLIESRFYLAQIAGTQDALLQEVLAKEQSPLLLSKWADLFLSMGKSEYARYLFMRAGEIDDLYFPAFIGMADTFSIMFQYDTAICLYMDLLEDFPENSKLVMSLARLFSWNKSFDEAYAWYDWMSSLNPKDPLPVREKARVAMWAKDHCLAVETYNKLLTPAVDSILYETLHESLPGYEWSLPTDDQLGSTYDGYKGYEAFSGLIAEDCLEMPQELAGEIQLALLDNLDLYLLQRSVALELKAKELAWHKRFIPSLPVYQQLIEIAPGLEEGLFDYAQVLCSLGQCSCARQLYNDILDLDPNHTMVRLALDYSLQKDHIAVGNNFSYWREIGSGTFSQSQIARYRNDTFIEYPFSCDGALRFIQQEYVENPFQNFKYYPAIGESIEGDYRFNENFKGSAGITYKNYFGKFRDRFTCFGRFNYNFNDCFQVNLGVERVNEIYNFFSLQQAIQSSIAWFGLTSNITRFWYAEANFRYFRYNDHNSQVWVNLRSEYQLTDESPNVVKLLFAGNYRNTAENSVNIVAGDELVNVIHPYWTPQRYFSGSVGLQLRHDYREFEFCEAPERYFDFFVIAEQDSVNNPSIEAIAAWKHDFSGHWGLELKGLIHRSRQWNAEGAWATIKYRF